MTAEREQQLKATQRRMLRWIVGVGRQKLPDQSSDGTGSNCTEPSERQSEDVKADTESWVDWIRRATGIAEQHSRRARVSDWVEAQRSRKWTFAGHVARRDDNRWGTRLLKWLPVGSRSVGRPKSRWGDSLVRYTAAAYGEQSVQSHLWIDLALDRTNWKLLHSDFVKESWS